MPVAIPDVANVTSTLTITGIAAGQVIDDATVNLTIAHTKDSDLQITLVAPDGTRIILVNHEGGSGQNFTNTTLDDAALLPIADGEAPFTGSFVPEQSLSGLVGKGLNGTWTLDINDTVPLNAGTLLHWSLNLTPGVVSTALTSGNLMDQDANSIGGETPKAGATTSANDVYATPDPENGVLLNATNDTYLLVAPYASDSLPIIVAGPVVQAISGTGFNGPRTFDGSAETIGPDAENDSTIAVPDYTGGTITALTVAATISYPVDADLTLSLIGPDGQSVVLAQGLAGADFTGTTFSDSAPFSITGATAPYGGTFRPEESLLAAFGGITPTGSWTLEITDTGTNSGTLTNWSLSFATDQDALALNKDVSSVDVTFDRDMNPATVTPASVLGITGPDGPIIKAYTYIATATPQALPTTPTTGVGTPLDSGLFISDDGTFLIGHLEVQINVTSTSDLGLTFELKGPRRHDDRAGLGRRRGRLHRHELRRLGDVDDRRVDGPLHRHLRAGAAAGDLRRQEARRRVDAGGRQPPRRDDGDAQQLGPDRDPGGDDHARPARDRPQPGLPADLPDQLPDAAGERDLLRPARLDDHRHQRQRAGHQPERRPGAPEQHGQRRLGPGGLPVDGRSGGDPGVEVDRLDRERRRRVRDPDGLAGTEHHLPERPRPDGDPGRPRRHPRSSSSAGSAAPGRRRTSATRSSRTRRRRRSRRPGRRSSAPPATSPRSRSTCSSAAWWRGRTRW